MRWGGGLRDGGGEGCLTTAGIQITTGSCFNASNRQKLKGPLLLFFYDTVETMVFRFR